MEEMSIKQYTAKERYISVSMRQAAELPLRIQSYQSHVISKFNSNKTITTITTPCTLHNTTQTTQIAQKFKYSKNAFKQKILYGFRLMMYFIMHMNHRLNGSKCLLLQLFRMNALNELNQFLINVNIE